MTHRLEPLLAPRSIAFVGASPRAGTPGNDMLRMIEKGGFMGEIYPVNPKYEEIEQYQCWPDQIQGDARRSAPARLFGSLRGQLIEIAAKPLGKVAVWLISDQGR
ncbi:hypothetical protein MPLSOD_410046 [Mesorhizobium sp. SOD10]|nr:hypothetical protein MPLSOD_410046 [Mesorhizobium sp. SOD10]